jgi:DNA-binding LacI/PurR family transcriptional regulator
MELGHERIGFLGQMPREADYSNWALDWCWAYDGYASAICVAGKAVNPDYVASTMGNSMEGAAEKTARLLQSLKCPTGIVCQNDLTAFGVIKAAHDLGLRVPEDVSVIGFDNDPSGAGMTPSLTTFGGHEELAFAALKRLFDAASGECTTYSVQAIDSPMILRNSAAPPQKEAV